MIIAGSRFPNPGAPERSCRAASARPSVFLSPISIAAIKRTDMAMAPSPAETAPNLTGFGKGSTSLIGAAFLWRRPLHLYRRHVHQLA